MLLWRRGRDPCIRYRKTPLFWSLDRIRILNIIITNMRNRCSRLISIPCWRPIRIIKGGSRNMRNLFWKVSWKPADENPSTLHPNFLNEKIRKISRSFASSMTGARFQVQAYLPLLRDNLGVLSDPTSPVSRNLSKSSRAKWRRQINEIPKIYLTNCAGLINLSKGKRVKKTWLHALVMMPAKTAEYRFGWVQKFSTAEVLAC